MIIVERAHHMFSSLACMHGMPRARTLLHDLPLRCCQTRLLNWRGQLERVAAEPGTLPRIEWALFGACMCMLEQRPAFKFAFLSRASRFGQTLGREGRGLNIQSCYPARCC